MQTDTPTAQSPHLAHPRTYPHVSKPSHKRNTSVPSRLGRYTVDTVYRGISKYQRYDFQAVISSVCYATYNKLSITIRNLRCVKQMISSSGLQLCIWFANLLTRCLDSQDICCLNCFVHKTKSIPPCVHIR